MLLTRLVGATVSGLLASLATAQSSEPVQDLRDLTIAYQADLGDLQRRYDVPLSGERHARLQHYLENRQQEFAELEATDLARDARIDCWLLQNDVERRLRKLREAQRRQSETVELMPHAADLVGLCEARRRLEPIEGEAAAEQLQTARRQVEGLIKQIKSGGFDALPLPVVVRAQDQLADLHRAVRSWFSFHDGYDPMFSWWVRTPWERYETAQKQYRETLRQRLIDSRSDDASLIGDPIGEEALLAELAHEYIAYSPAELVEIAEKEFAWCDAEFAKASREMGCGEDWRKALEMVKQRHAQPGQQPQLIRKLAHEAIDFLTERDLITLPPLARECWRMAMMTAAAQRVNPFFLGGETIRVSFPTDAMEHDFKLQSLRSNNEHFCRATVHHELIPGHWLQQHSQARHRTWRRMFSTPFWLEGWALYWEMRLYDLGLAATAEDRVGMLYWRKHRCARIGFSLNFHLGRWTGPECVDYLIERVGHEPAAAEAEVRRSVSGAYGPLYQAAYMVGGLQLRALHQELVVSGAMSERGFHDAVLQQNSIPVALLRSALTKTEPTRNAATTWRFADSL
ncbi:MAG: DUF885 family protein [Planctomycetota bacterium]|nr:DUF885 family protein [Planctomycetota bacterium]